MDFVEHNLKISPIKTGSSSIYRIDQLHGFEDNPACSTVFVTSDNVKELIESWLTSNGLEQHRDWLLAKLKDSDAAVKQQQQ